MPIMSNHHQKNNSPVGSYLARGDSGGDGSGGSRSRTGSASATASASRTGSVHASPSVSSVRTPKMPLEGPHGFPAVVGSAPSTFDRGSSIAAIGDSGSGSGNDPLMAGLMFSLDLAGDGGVGGGISIGRAAVSGRAESESGLAAYENNNNNSSSRGLAAGLFDGSSPGASSQGSGPLDAATASAMMMPGELGVVPGSFSGGGGGGGGEVGAGPFPHLLSATWTRRAK